MIDVFEGFWLCSNNIYWDVEGLCFQWAACCWCCTSVTSWTCFNFCGMMFTMFYIWALILFSVIIDGTYLWYLFLNFGCMQQGTKRMPGIAVTKSVVATEPGGRRREEIFVDIIEKISITFSSSVSKYVLKYQMMNFITLFHCYFVHQYSMSIDDAIYKI